MMTQPTDATKTEGDLNEALKSPRDSKSRVSSPVSATAQHQSSTGILLNSGSSVMVATGKLFFGVLNVSVSIDLSLSISIA